MEVSDDDEEIIELNEQQTNSKTIDKKEKTTSKSSIKKIKWNITKYSVDSISQIVDSESSQSFYNNYSINEVDNSKEKEEEKNIEEKKEIKEINNNNDNNKENTSFPIPETEFIYTFTWEEGGNEVKIIGSFTDWKEPYLMKKDVNDNVYKISLPLHNKIYFYKFIVDGEWKFSQIQPTKQDNDGNINNFLDLTNFIFNNTTNFTNTNANINENSSNKNNDNDIDNNNKEEENKKSSKKIIKKKKSSKLSGKRKTKKIKTKEKNEKCEFGRDYQILKQMTEPLNNNVIGKPFLLNIESELNKIGNKIFYEFNPRNFNSSHKSYINLNGSRHTILNHLILLKNLNKKFNKKVGISQRYREKATTIIYYNCFSKEEK